LQGQARGKGTMIFHPQFLAPIEQFIYAANNNKLRLYKDPRIEKSTKANMFKILGPNGVQQLSLHLNRSSLKQGISEVQLSSDASWRNSHIKSIETSYRKAAFFEFYNYKLQPVFSLDSLEACIEQGYKQALKALELDLTIEWTTEKPMASQKYTPSYKSYEQVFSDRFGFHQNLSILDLIYNQGPMARDILLNE